MKKRLAWLIAVAALSIAGPSRAQRAPGRDRFDLGQAESALRSGSLDDARSALETMGISGSTRAIPVLTAYVRGGPPTQLIETVVEAIGAIGGPQSAPVLLDLMNHRRNGVRLRAVEAAANLRSPEVAAALQASLDDSDPQVRAAAARALSRSGNHDSVDVLFRALSRGVFEAAGAIGALAHVEDVDRFLGFLGRVPFDKMIPGLDALLARRELGNPPRVSVVRKLQELATVEIKSFLQGFVESLPTREGGPVRQAAEEAISRIADK